MKKIIAAAALIFAFAPSCAALEISAEAGIIIAADTGEVIYEKNPDDRLPMASTTKIMTAITALESSGKDDIVTVSANAERQEGTSLYLKRGDKIRMEDLLYGLMLNSGNDAAVAVAEYISGSVENFSCEMNKKAEKIGIKNSSFKNPSGLDDAEHYTTARDLALISAYAMQNTDFKTIVSTKEKSVRVNNAETLYFANHNKLLKRYDGAIGVKTGYTKRSGRCLVSAAERNGVMLIAVTLNDPNDWNDHENMLDYGFALCSPRQILAEGRELKRLELPSGKELCAAVGEEVSVTAVKDRVPKCEVRLHLPKKISTTICAGEKIGEAEVIINGKTIKTVPITAKEIITRKNTFAESLFRVLAALENCY